MSFQMQHYRHARKPVRQESLVPQQIRKGFSLMRGTKLISFVATAALLFLALPAFSAVINSNGFGGGNWNAGATWQGGSVPLSGDSVIIVGSDFVTVTDTQTIA